MNLLNLEKNITFIILSLTSAASYATMPSNFYVNSSSYEYQLIINNRISGSANAGLGCYVLGNDIKCFTINIDQYGGTNCQEAIYSSNGQTKINWTNFICGSFAITELLNDPRTTLGYYVDDLQNIDFINRLNDYYVYGKRIELPLDYNTAPAVVYIYGTSSTTAKTFEETSTVIENILLAIDKPQWRSKLDGQRFILTGTNDNPSRMPGLNELGIPSWVDTVTKGFSMWDLKTTIVSDQMICRAPSENSKYFEYEHVVHQMAYTIMDTLGLGSQAIQKTVLIDSRINTSFDNGSYSRETFPIMIQGWFDSNFNKQGPYTRSELKNHFPATYSYLSTIFNPNTNWKPKCSSYTGTIRPHAVEPIYHDFYYYPDYYSYRDFYRQNNYRYYRQYKERYIFNIYVQTFFSTDKHKKRKHDHARTGLRDWQKLKKTPVVFKNTQAKNIFPVTTTVINSPQPITITNNPPQITSTTPVPAITTSQPSQPEENLGNITATIPSSESLQSTPMVIEQITITTPEPSANPVIEEKMIEPSTPEQEIIAPVEKKESPETISPPVEIIVPEEKKQTNEIIPPPQLDLPTTPPVDQPVPEIHPPIVVPNAPLIITPQIPVLPPRPPIPESSESTPAAPEEKSQLDHQL